MSKKGILISLVVMIFILALSIISVAINHSYIIVSVIFVILAMVPFLIRFERKQVDTREIVLIAVMSAVCAVSRMPFASLPNIQPMTGLIILVAYIFGGEVGFMVGATSALASNMLLGQGPWTPWQMFAFGFIGLLGGRLREKGFIKTKKKLVIFGFIAGFVYGFIMNIWVVVGFVSPINMQTILVTFGASLLLDLAHALSNALIIYLVYHVFIRKLERIKRKY
jgi:energy-coupling factor transport system substrate-specific component